MFDNKRMECIFVELYTDNNYSHLCIECIPLGLHVADMGPIYFKVFLKCVTKIRNIQVFLISNFQKAILESESEWAQNKTLVTLKDQDLHKMVVYFFDCFPISWFI